MNMNPFANTKASYFEDPEIVDYWVDIGNNYKELFNSLVLPDSSIPVRILGGKGSGKTHILRYFSFNSQLLKAQSQDKNILELIQDDGYIGVYIETTGLQSNRFSGRGYTQKEWDNIFFYYMNLEFIEKSFKCILQTLEGTKTSFEPIDIKNVLEEFYPNPQVSELKSLSEIYELIRQERISLDQQISDLSVPNRRKAIEILPLFEPIEGFYKIISNSLEMYAPLKNVKVLFILDEFENLSINHQKYFNTLLRHPKAVNRIALRISGRLNAKKTIDTYDDKEKLLEDSEIKTVFLEDFLSSSFKVFAHDLYEKRINNRFSTSVDLESSFEESKDADERTLNDIMQKNQKKKKYHFSELEEYLKKYKEINSDQIGLIINNLTYEENWLLEKANIFLIYQKWNSDDLVKESEIIKTHCQQYISDGTGKIASVLDKHINDLKHQLFRSYRRSVSYSGYSNIVYMSRNNPRIFLTALNYIFKKCNSSNINMLESKYIEGKLQDQALLEASGWFWDNYTDDVRDYRVVWAVQKLMEFFRRLRRTPKPSEKNLIAFNLPNGITKEIEQIVRAAVEHSLFVPTSTNRLDRNTGEYKATYRIHPMLSPKWGLPVTTGGTIDFSLDEVNALFLNDEEKWEICVKERVAKMTPPFGKKNKTTIAIREIQGSLF